MIVSGSWGSTIKLWDVESRSEVYNFTGNFQKVFVVTFSPDLKLIASGSYDNTVRLWSVEDKQ
jgi:WD40 repeat protein